MSMKKLMATRQRARSAASALLIGIAALALFACATQPAADPMQVAEAHVANESAAVSADVAAWIAEQHPFTRAVGAAALEAAINQEVEWRYEPAIDKGDNLSEVRAYADFVFSVRNPHGGFADIDAILPYDISVDTRAGSVLSIDARYSEAYLAFGGDYELADDQ